MNDGIKGELDLKMSKGSTGLYFIKDAVSNVRISGFMEFPTEAHACMSFCQFIEEQKAKTSIENIDCFKLILSASVRPDDTLDLLNNTVICDGSDCVDIRDLYINAYKHLYEV